MNIRGRAHFKWYATVTDVRGQSTQFEAAILPNLDVVHDAHAMAKSFRAAPLKRLPDGWQAKRFAGMDGQVEVLLVHEVEGIQVTGWRKPRLGSGDIESKYALVAVPNSQLSNLHRACELAHGGDDEADANSVRTGPQVEALENRLGYVVQRQPVARAEFRCIANFGVHDPVRRQIGGAFLGNACQRLARLQHAHRVLEALQVELQALPVGTGSESPGQF